MPEAECLVKPEILLKLNEMAVRHCGDIFAEISYYQPKETHDIETKWTNERYNRDNFIRLYELFISEREWPFGSGNDLRAKDAIRSKLSQFKAKILSRTTYLPLHIDFTKFPFGEKTEEIGWDE